MKQSILKHIKFFIILAVGLFGSSYLKTAGSTTPFPFASFVVQHKNSGTMKTNEIWKPIKGYEGLYEVSNYGRIKSLGRTTNTSRGSRFKKEAILRQHFASYRKKYLSVMLHNNNEKRFLVHRLVLSAFSNKEYKNPLDVNHKNGLPWDNYLSNLEWCTRSENIKHSYAKLGRVSAMKGVFGKNNHRSIPVDVFTKDGEYIESFDSITSFCVKYKALNGNAARFLKGYGNIIKGVVIKYKNKEI